MSTPYSSTGKSFKDLKQAQKARITDYMYLETQNFVSANGRIPVSVEDCETIVQKVCGHINIQISFDEVYKEYRKKCLHIIERLESNGLPEHIRSHEEIKALQRERATRHPKHKSQAQPTKSHDLETMDQDERFFYIAGYTSGGVPYGVTWEEMGLEPWEELDSCHGQGIYRK